MPKGIVTIESLKNSNCDNDQINNVHRKHLAKFRYCYEKNLRDNPDVEGSIDVEVDISKGSVSAISIQRNSLKSPTLGHCFQKILTRIRLPESCTGTTTLSFSLMRKPNTSD